jgi:hypothetical protein
MAHGISNCHVFEVAGKGEGPVNNYIGCEHPYVMSSSKTVA